MSNIKCLYDRVVRLEDLKLHPQNRNKHPRDQIVRLAEILMYQGWRAPVKVSKRSGFVTAGHGRIQAAIYNGWDSVPVNFQNYNSDEEEYADLTADNAIASWSELDLSAVNMDLGALGPNLNIDLLGIKGFQLDITVSEHKRSASSTDEDEVPEHVEPITQLGDCYQLGVHRLLCGDSTSTADVQRLMNGEKAHMVFTDPPYGVSYQSNMRTKSAKFDVIDNDETFLSEWIKLLPLVSYGWVFVWTSWKVLGKWIEITAPIGALTNLIVWDKGGGGIGDLSKTFATDHELALVFNRGAEITGKRLGSVWSIGKDRAVEYVHPTQKPVELAQTAIENCTHPKGIILDLFGGSGSTLIACEKTNRQCFMMEIDPAYCDVIVSRWEKYAGKQANKINY